MRALLTLFILSLPCAALAGEDLRIVRCTEGLAAVQESYQSPYQCDQLGCLVMHYGTVTKWRTLPAGCIPLKAAERLYAEEMAWRNRPPAPVVIEPVEVIKH